MRGYRRPVVTRRLFSVTRTGSGGYIHSGHNGEGCGPFCCYNIYNETLTPDGEMGNSVLLYCSSEVRRGSPYGDGEIRVTGIRSTVVGAMGVCTAICLSRGKVGETNGSGRMSSRRGLTMLRGGIGDLDDGGVVLCSSCGSSGLAERRCIGHSGTVIRRVSRLRRGVRRLGSRLPARSGSTNGFRARLRGVVGVRSFSERGVRGMVGGIVVGKRSGVRVM